MGFEEIRRRNEARKQLMQSKIGGSFVKFAEDQDCMVVKLVPPFEGYDRVVKTYNGDYKEKPHYRMHILGDCNLIRGKPISNPQIVLTYQQVRELKDDVAKIWTCPFSAVKAIQREISKKRSILFARRDGVPKNTNTTYTILAANQMDDDDWEKLLPKLSRDDIAKLQEEEKWESISDEKLQALQSMKAAATSDDKEDT
jgi:hypothetical protein